ncbi:hypothetical protein GCM10011506_20170 [Marivirga lumbricoides]|uniref:Uncharacterized protein n=1 Tax=Marivirga lumbricoides TaxID=1046115 RepID=A0ABQ1M4W7_9BACT|nr:hypothetical protein GCM10011506_20170 [Marivirga lumbricoides]
MTEEEAKSVIQRIPIGAKLQLIKKNGSIADVSLASHDISSIPKKEYGHITVPELPPALIVFGGTRFGKFRIEIREISNIAWVG